MAKIETKENLNRKIASARSSLLVMMIFTVVNMVMAVMDAGTYFLFSLSVPYYLTMLGMYMEGGIVGTYTVTGMVIGGAILVVFLLCWLLSKKKTGWLTVATVLMVLDSLALAVFSFALYENPAVNFMDFLFHFWILVTLSQAILAARKLKKLPAENTEDIDLSSFYGTANTLGNDSDHMDF